MKEQSNSILFIRIVSWSLAATSVMLVGCGPTFQARNNGKSLSPMGKLLKLHQEATALINDSELGNVDPNLDPNNLPDPVSYGLDPSGSPQDFPGLPSDSSNTLPTQPANCSRLVQDHADAMTSLTSGLEGVQTDLNSQDPSQLSPNLQAYQEALGTALQNMVDQLDSCSQSATSGHDSADAYMNIPSTGGGTTANNSNVTTTKSPIKQSNDCTNINVSLGGSGNKQNNICQQSNQASIGISGDQVNNQVAIQR